MTAEVVERFRHPGVDVEALGDRSQRILQLLDVRERPLSVALVDDAEIRALNLRWRGQDRPTDVLSFGQGEPEGGPIAGAPPPPLGDVIISVERAEVQARERDASLGGVGYALLDELTFLALHGVLHLLGHDHERDDEAEVMEALEARIFAEFSVYPPRPHHREGAQ